LRVLLISPNRERVPDPVFPLGLSYVAASLRADGHDVAALDLCFENDVETAVSRAVEEVSPDVVGLSLRNIDDVSYPRSVCYIDQYRETIGLVRRYSNARVVIGGAGLTIMPAEFMKLLDADYAVAGEGEAAFTLLLRRLKEGDAPEERIIRNLGSGAMEWTGVMPDRSIFDTDRYYEEGGMLNIQTKRGCPFQCVYCSYPLIEGRRYRMRTAGSVADELERVVSETGVRHFFFVDSIFNHPPEYAESICDAIMERGLEISWTCYGNPAFMSPRLAEKMKAAGCSSVEFGTDSLLDTVLDIMKKGFTFRQVREASRICSERGIKFCHFVFIGAPGDTVDSVKENLERLESLGADVSVIMAGIRIFPDTDLAVMAEEELGIRQDSISVNPVYYISPPVVKEMDSIVSYIRDNHPRWILPGFEININERLQTLLRRAGIKGSLWEELMNR